MTFDTGTFGAACQHGAKPRERVEIQEEEEDVDTVQEKMRQAEQLELEKKIRALRARKEKENREAKRQQQQKQTRAKKAQASRTAGGPRTLNSVSIRPLPLPSPSPQPTNTDSNTLPHSQIGKSGEPAKRGKVRVNPVTGALEAVADTKDDTNYVREGCMRIHKKYMGAAVAAGLGGGNGMYGHIGGVRGMLNSSKNTGTRPRDGPTGSRHASAAFKNDKGSMITTKAVRQGGTTIHTVSTKMANPNRKKLARNPKFNRRGAGACDLGGNPIHGDQKRRSNIKTGVAGRTKSVRSTGGKMKGLRKEPQSYGQMKGVVNTMGGATSAASQRYQANKQNQGGKFGSGSSVVNEKPRRQVMATSNTLGGGSKAKSREEMRAARLAAMEKRFGK